MCSGELSSSPGGRVRLGTTIAGGGAARSPGSAAVDWPGICFASARCACRGADRGLGHAGRGFGARRAILVAAPDLGHERARFRDHAWSGRGRVRVGAFGRLGTRVRRHRPPHRPRRSRARHRAHRGQRHERAVRGPVPSGRPCSSSSALAPIPTARKNAPAAERAVPANPPRRGDPVPLLACPASPGPPGTERQQILDIGRATRGLPTGPHAPSGSNDAAA
jgi:hypothetical protein